MANELKHKDIGTQLTKAEFEDVTLHQLDSQATGDLIKATSATQLSRLPVGANDKVLTVVAGVPAWADAPAGSLAEDIIDTGFTTVRANANASGRGLANAVAAGADLDLISTTNTYDADSRTVAVGVFPLGWGAGGLCHKLRLYMGGAQVTESGWIAGSPYNYSVIGTRALSGSQTCKMSVHNYDGSSQTIHRVSSVNIGDVLGTFIGVGSIKLA